MDIGRAFSYIFEDDDWVGKVVIAAIVSIIPIVNFALAGWTIALVRNMLNGEPRPLPEWDDFGQKFIDGLLYAVAGIIYSLPLILFICLIAVVGGGLGGSSRGAAGLAGGLTCLLVPVSFIYAIAVAGMTYIGMVRYSRRGQFSDYLQFGQNLSLVRENLGTLFTLLIFLIIAGFIFGLFGWIPCLGWIISLALGTPVTAHLQGQAAVEIVSKRKRG